MQVSIDTTKWYDRIWASFIFFTRLPFWRLHQPAKEAYQTVVEHWPLVGWLTGSVMGAVIYFGSMFFSYEIAILLAILTRLLMTGALHEDGLADFMDGFGGGGKDRQRILDIMKDSHIGTYGVIGLIMYFRCCSLHSTPCHPSMLPSPSPWPTHMPRCSRHNLSR
jgi:adenosylcobinamide-GDP ribazoletransferase